MIKEPISKHLLQEVGRGWEWSAKKVCKFKEYVDLFTFQSNLFLFYFLFYFLAVLNTFMDSRKLEKLEVSKIILLGKKARKQAAKRYSADAGPGERLAVPDDPTARREEHLHIELQQRMNAILAAILSYTPSIQ